MENPEFLKQSSEDLQNISSNNSLFRDSHHYWIKESLPFAYAMACIEVVLKNSEQARIIYQIILDAWIEPDLLDFFKRVNSVIPKSGQEYIRNALKNPEDTFYPDPAKPFKLIDTFFTDSDIEENLPKDNGEELSPKEEKEYTSLFVLTALMFEFILVGFNRESDVEKDRFRVIPGNNNHWLFWAVAVRSSLETNKITLERLRQFYKRRKYKGKILDFHEILTNEPMSRWHRRIIASGKAVGAKLKNDRVFMDAARDWYQCRIVYRSINKYCDDTKNYRLDPENIRKKIKPVDDAVGYITRLPKKPSK